MKDVSRPSLPPELIRCVCDHLDPTDTSGRRALARMARSSSALYELAMPALYRQLTLDDLGFLDLLACGHLLSRADAEYEAFTADDSRFLMGEDLLKRWSHLPVPSERWRHSLGLVQSLTVLGPLFEKTLDLLWDVCIPLTPLFPNVTTLRVGDSPLAIEIGWPTERYRPQGEEPDSDIFVFDSPDYCGEGDSAGPLLEFLPSRDRGYGHIALHTGDFQCITPPKSWTTFRVFDGAPELRLSGLRSVCSCGKHDPPLVPSTLEEIAQGKLGDGIEKLAEHGPVELCLASRPLKEEVAQYTVEEQARIQTRREKLMNDWEYVADLVKSHHNGNLKITVDRSSEADSHLCQPCVMCGKCERSR